MNSFQPDDIEELDSDFNSELSAAIERAKNREVSSMNVEQLKLKVLSRTSTPEAAKSTELSNRFYISYKTVAALVCVAAMGMIVVIQFAWSDRTSDAVGPHSTMKPPRYSAITKVVLTSSSLGSLDADFESMYSRIDGASEALQLSEIRREIGNILEDEIDWRNKR